MVFSMCISAAAGMIAAVTASIAAAVPFTAYYRNTLLTYSELLRREESDSLTSLEFVHFLQTPYSSSCCVYVVSSEFLIMHVHANHAGNFHIGSSFFACIIVLWSLILCMKELAKQAWLKLTRPDTSHLS